MSTEDRLVLVTGATGRQGGSVTRHLLSKGWRVRALTRNRNQEAVHKLIQMGAEVIEGDLYSRPSLDRAVRGVYGVFSVQNYWEHGYEGEVKQGKNLADAAKTAQVQHYIQSTVGGADRHTGIPHFESKWEIEQYVRGLGLPLTILRPVYFMDNFLSPGDLQDISNGKLIRPLHITVLLQMIAVDDIGALAALAFENRDEYLGQALEIAGDEMTMPHAASIFGRAIGHPVFYEEASVMEMRRTNPEAAAMWEWLNEKEGYQVNISALRKRYPALLTLEAWLRKIDFATIARKQEAKERIATH